RDQRRVFQMHRADHFAVIALRDHAVAEPEPDVAGVEEELSARAAQSDLNDLRHDDLYGAGARAVTPAGAGGSRVSRTALAPAGSPRLRGAAGYRTGRSIASDVPPRIAQGRGPMHRGIRRRLERGLAGRRLAPARNQYSQRPAPWPGHSP